MGSSVELVYEIRDRVDDPGQPVREALGLVPRRDTRQNEHGVHTGFEAQTMSVSILSPTIADASECA